MNGVELSRRADPERIAQKREQIAAHAGRLFAAQGYDRTSVAAVAKAAGTSPASHQPSSAVARIASGIATRISRQVEFVDGDTPIERVFTR